MERRYKERGREREEVPTTFSVWNEPFVQQRGSEKKNKKNIDWKTFHEQRGSVNNNSCRHCWIPKHRITNTSATSQTNASILSVLNTVYVFLLSRPCKAFDCFALLAMVTRCGNDYKKKNWNKNSINKDNTSVTAILTRKNVKFFYNRENPKHMFRSVFISIFLSARLTLDFLKSSYPSWNFWI